jgi:FAD:protein FMN transferase
LACCQRQDTGWQHSGEFGVIAHMRVLSASELDDSSENGAPCGIDSSTSFEPRSDGALYRHTTSVFTCTVEFATVDKPIVLFLDLEARLRAFDRQFSRFRPDSEVSLFNARAGVWVDISASLRQLLRHSLNVAVASKGLVNIAVLGPLLNAGYRCSWPFTPTTPDPEAAMSATPVPPLTSVLELQDTRARLMPGFGIDVGAVAKGFWADQIVDRLGPNSASNLGGDIACRGKGPDGDGWRVTFPPEDAVFSIEDGGIATSGIEKRRWGSCSHHLIDPRTGHPSCSDLTRATILANCASTADWVASAAVIGGSTALHTLARRKDVVRCQFQRVPATDEIAMSPESSGPR